MACLSSSVAVSLADPHCSSSFSVVVAREPRFANEEEVVGENYYNGDGRRRTRRLREGNYIVRVEAHLLRRRKIKIGCSSEFQLRIAIKFPDVNNELPDHQGALFLFGWNWEYSEGDRQSRRRR